MSFQNSLSSVMSVLGLMRKVRLTPWLKTMFASLVATTTGIILTFGTKSCAEEKSKRATERIAGMMVVSNIDAYKEKLVSVLPDMERTDSLFGFFYDISPDSVYMVGEDTLTVFLNELAYRNINITDRSVERVFSSSVAMWESIASADFMQNAGKCFALIDSSDKIYAEMNAEKFRIYSEVYVDNMFRLGSKADFVACLLKSPAMRFFMESFHSYYLPSVRVTVEALEEQNKHNMRLLGITDEDMRGFVLEREIKTYNTEY